MKAIPAELAIPAEELRDPQLHRAVFVALELAHDLERAPTLPGVRPLAAWCDAVLSEACRRAEDGARPMARWIVERLAATQPPAPAPGPVDPEEVSW